MRANTGLVCRLVLTFVCSILLTDKTLSLVDCSTIANIVSIPKPQSLPINKYNCHLSSHLTLPVYILLLGSARTSSISEGTFFMPVFPA
jgi:hypothetical protein